MQHCTRLQISISRQRSSVLLRRSTFTNSPLRTGRHRLQLSNPRSSGFELQPLMHLVVQNRTPCTRRDLPHAVHCFGCTPLGRLSRLGCLDGGLSEFVFLVLQPFLGQGLFCWQSDPACRSSSGCDPACAVQTKPPWPCSGTKVFVQSLRVSNVMESALDLRSSCAYTVPNRWFRINLH